MHELNSFRHLVIQIHALTSVCLLAVAGNVKRETMRASSAPARAMPMHGRSTKLMTWSESWRPSTPRRLATKAVNWSPAQADRAPYMRTVPCPSLDRTRRTRGAGAGGSASLFSHIPRPSHVAQTGLAWQTSRSARTRVRSARTCSSPIRFRAAGGPQWSRGAGAALGSKGGQLAKDDDAPGPGRQGPNNLPAPLTVWPPSVFADPVAS